MMYDGNSTVKFIFISVLNIYINIIETMGNICPLSKHACCGYYILLVNMKHMKIMCVCPTVYTSSVQCVINTGDFWCLIYPRL